MFASDMSRLPVPINPSDIKKVSSLVDELHNEVAVMKQQLDSLCAVMLLVSATLISQTEDQAKD
jgi:hypothetical protein